MKSDGRLSLVAVVVLAFGAAAALMWGRFASPPAAPAAPTPVSAATAPATPSTTPSATPSRTGSAAPQPTASTATSSAATSSTPLPELPSDPRCPPAMAFVHGHYCPFIAHRCSEWVGPFPKRRRGRRKPEDKRCRKYENHRICEGRPALLHFCIDRFEYPNIAGARPAILVHYRQARAACRAEGKRLCELEEWTLACEGERIWPYPYGIERSPTACNIDRFELRPNAEALGNPRSVSMEVQRIDRRVESGSLERCVSSYKVFDMTGNVSEWIHDREAESDAKRSSSRLAGGHWGRVPATCRATTGRRRSHRSHRVGFRCCAATLDGLPARRLLDPELRLPLRRPLVE